MPLRNIEWLREDEVLLLVEDLREQYSGDPIHLISYNPIGYVGNLGALSNFYDDNILKLAAVICRSLIQGHPLQDGNKRFGMYVANCFLEMNGISVIASDEEYVRVALELARGTMDLDALYQWFCENTQSPKSTVRNELAFDRGAPRYNEETEAAIREARDIMSGKTYAKTYASARELFDELDAET